MKSLHRLTPAPANAVILGCVWISVVQCMVLSSCLTSCVTNLVSFTHLLFVFAGTRTRSRLERRFIFSSGHPLFHEKVAKNSASWFIFFPLKVGEYIISKYMQAILFICCHSLDFFFFEEFKDWVKDSLNRSRLYKL